MFELTKMNMSQTGASLTLPLSFKLTVELGYKLRKHIENALKARSKAVRSALQNYNIAAQALVPPRPPLSWDDVVEYVFLADFDLLSDTRTDVRLKLWAKPASRVLIDQYFKMERAQEEIARLNVEIPHLTTYIRDEEAFLLQQEELLLASNAPLSRQLHLRCLKLIRSNNLHIRWLKKLTSLSGFLGTIEPGISVEAAAHNQAEMIVGNREAAQEHARGDDEGEDDENDQIEAEVTDAFCVVVEGPH